ncbi:hypothetical protein MUK42_05024 [Musa troglodytarum]|uniref:Uncharacterized protein n=1 Tax=Musa troglodytarum TaxID=320322 RepID=A0A9E7ETT7_9LILI|nr:hypothetical protein MUK42_05024 [Musa troglodytarum]
MDMRIGLFSSPRSSYTCTEEIGSDCVISNMISLDSPVPKPCCCFRPIVGATSASTFVVESSAGKFSFRDHAGLHLTGQDESMDPGNRLIQISRECSSLNFSRVQVFDDI